MNPDPITEDPEAQAARHDNARQILQQSHIPDVWREMNQALLKGRGWFEEYDSGVLLKWGTGYTRRHIWLDVAGDTIRFRLRPHRRCDPTTTPLACDGEYHTMTRAHWSNLAFVKDQLKYYYEHPVAEASDD